MNVQLSNPTAMTARQKANRSKKLAAEAVYARRVMTEVKKVVGGGDEDHVFYTDSKGRKVRDVTIANVPVAEIRYHLLNNRVVDEEEMLIAVGKPVLQYMISKGYLRRAVNERTGRAFGYLWITEAAAANYKLPNPVIEGYTAKFAA